MLGEGIRTQEKTAEKQNKSSQNVIISNGITFEVRSSSREFHK